MPNFEFHVTVFDKPNDGDKLRHDEGDLINIQNAGVDLGRKVLDYFLIIPVTVDTTLTAQELKHRYCIPLYEDGTIEGIDWREIIEEDGLDPATYPPHQYVVNLQNGQPRLKPAIIAKNRYQLSLDHFKSANFDMAKLRNKFEIYQPLLKESRIAGCRCFGAQSGHQLMHDGTNYKTKRTRKTQRVVYQDKDGNLFLRKKEPAITVELTDEPEYTIHTNTISISREQEFVIDPVALNLFIDKYDSNPIDFTG